MRTPSERRERPAHAVIVAEPDPRRRAAIRAALAGARPPAGRPRWHRIRFARDCEEVVGLLSAEVSAVLLNLSEGRTGAVRAIERLRAHHPELALVCYVTAGPRAEAMAAWMAGADYVTELEDGDALYDALDLAMDRRRLALLIERSAAELEVARRRLATLGGTSSVVLPGLRPPAAAGAILPFHEAVRRYLAACARLYGGDPRGLAQRLGVSYFALRRLLKRYGVPYPGRTLRRRSESGASR